MGAWLHFMGISAPSILSCRVRLLPCCSDPLLADDPPGSITCVVWLKATPLPQTCRRRAPSRGIMAHDRLGVTASPRTIQVEQCKLQLH